MKVINSNFFTEAVRYIKFGASFGWHERNAGNISLRLLPSEIVTVKDDIADADVWIKLPHRVLNMADEYIFTTVSGSYFIDIDHDIEHKFCICKISRDGSAYSVVWGGEKPTSEFFGHVLSLSELKSKGARRAVYHAHPANSIALSYLIPSDDKSFSEAIWESETECPFVIPNGVGVLGFHIPGSYELAKATSEKIKLYNAVIWSFHGVFATGESIMDAFGLVAALEKSAEIKLKVMSAGVRINTISKEQQKATAEYYGFALNEFKF